MNIYDNSEIHSADLFTKRGNSKRTTRKVHGVRGNQNECLISFANIFDFEDLCKSIRNRTYSSTSMKAMKNMKSNKNTGDPEKLMKPLHIHDNI